VSGDLTLPSKWGCNRKDQPFSWGVEVENAFQSLKALFTIAPLFIHVNLAKPFVLETDASNFALGAILSQHGKYNLFHLLVFVRSYILSC
jgi:hypothetical protein